MTLVLENPTKAEIKRFDELQRQGLLPSESLKKIEIERRLGIIPEDKPKGFITKENWWFYAAMGALGLGILYVYIKSPSRTQTQTASLTTYNIEEEDLLNYIYNNEID